LKVEDKIPPLGEDVPPQYCGVGGGKIPLTCYGELCK